MCSFPFQEILISAEFSPDTSETVSHGDSVDGHGWDPSAMTLKEGPFVRPKQPPPKRTHIKCTVVFRTFQFFGAFWATPCFPPCFQAESHGLPLEPGGEGVPVVLHPTDTKSLARRPAGAGELGFGGLPGHRQK